MAMDPGEVERSFSAGEKAFALMRAFGHPAHPYIYEVWYTYAAGTHREITTAIDTLMRYGTAIGPDQIYRIYEAHFADDRLAEKMDAVGGSVSSEIDQVLGMIGAATRSAEGHRQSLDGIGRTLVENGEDASVFSLIETLVHEMVSSNADLAKRLSLSRRQMMRLKDNLEAVRSESLTDPLTGLANRKSFDSTLADAVAAAEPFALLLADIDRFKKFNDDFGHLIGDQVLRLVATTIKPRLKGLDTAARYGGEEIAIILPQTALEGARVVAENIRSAVMTRDLVKRSTGEKLGRITLSVGVAIWRPGDSAQALIARADRCLYVAKDRGRNRVVTEMEASGDQDAAHAAGI